MVIPFRRPLKYIGYTLFFLLALVYFTPKIALYYLFESKINPYAIVINDELLEDNGLCLSIKDGVVFAKGIETAEISEIKVKMFGLYNSVDLTSVTLSSTASAFIPLNIEDVYISYSILNPLNINAYGNGDFGELKASFNLIDFNLHLELEASTIMEKDFKSTLSNLKRLDTGVYSYDKTFKF